MEELVCNSCKTKIVNNKGTARFMCPNCSKYDIIRCMHCREISAKYACAQCNFTGPN